MSRLTEFVAQAKLYRSVIDDVVTSVREAFLDDGVDEQILMDFKLMWEKRLQDTRAVPSDKDGDPPAGPSTSNSRGGRSTVRPDMHQNPGPSIPAFPQHAMMARGASGGQWEPRPGAPVVQLDGLNDSSDDDPDEDDYKDNDDDHEDNEEEANDEENEDPGEDEVCIRW